MSLHVQNEIFFLDFSFCDPYAKKEIGNYNMFRSIFRNQHINLKKKQARLNFIRWDKPSSFIFLSFPSEFSRQYSVLISCHKKIVNIQYLYRKIDKTSKAILIATKTDNI